ncbi:hypothetical protein ZIOFF_071930 [Zingiber officinale]|uniref:Uncharacterized protein n=1 Tax=Zingiber officinale TaxID=94328 RepID=A0A8J5EP19_ZINOF|nr:hypothetical protein ZIOFF_071930 [Zingiber officinale]
MPPNGSNGFTLVFDPSDSRPVLHIILLSFYIFKVATSQKPEQNHGSTKAAGMAVGFDTFSDIFLSVRTRGSQKGKRREEETVDPFAKKGWYDIKAPSVFSVRNVGKTLVSRTQEPSLMIVSNLLVDAFIVIVSEGLNHRVFEGSLVDLQNDEDQTYSKIRLRAEDVQGKNVLTNFWGMNVTTDKLRFSWQTISLNLTRNIVMTTILQCKGCYTSSMTFDGSSLITISNSMDHENSCFQIPRQETMERTAQRTEAAAASKTVDNLLSCNAQTVLRHSTVASRTPISLSFSEVGKGRNGRTPRQNAERQ